MHEYLCWDEKFITDFSEGNIDNLYDKGYVFTRKEKGLMQKTRSIRVDLSKFILNSENKRILRKTEDVGMNITALPFSEYHWSIGKLAKDFYDLKFGEGTFSANKIKEIVTDAEKSNFNTLLAYQINGENIGYCICFASKNIFHYSYPFYDVTKAPKDMGLGMMTRAIEYAKNKGLQYVYLGSAQRPTDTYKFQFAGIEWFDGKKWQTNFEELKALLLQ